MSDIEVVVLVFKILSLEFGTPCRRQSQDGNCLAMLVMALKTVDRVLPGLS